MPYVFCTWLVWCLAPNTSQMVGFGTISKGGGVCVCVCVCGGGVYSVWVAEKGAMFYGPWCAQTGEQGGRGGAGGASHVSKCVVCLPCLAGATCPRSWWWSPEGRNHIPNKWGTLINQSTPNIQYSNRVLVATPGTEAAAYKRHLFKSVSYDPKTISNSDSGCTHYFSNFKGSD